MQSWACSVQFNVIVPARMASARLPNKPLALIAGVPMVVRVAQRVLSISADAGLARVVVAADSPDIIEACHSWGVHALLTRSDHASGTDRVAQACDILHLPDDALVVNVQGDEPLIEPQLVVEVARLLHTMPLACMSTAAKAITSVEDFHNPNVVKVVLETNGFALYFSRACLPFLRGSPDQLPNPAPLRHIGLYAYRAGFLRQFTKLSSSPLECAESLEQLRALWHGYRIAVHVTEHDTAMGVDTPEDLERVQRALGP